MNTEYIIFIEILLGDSLQRVPWSNYELFVAKHRVVLDGWPSDCPMNPDKLSLGSCTIALQALAEGTCKWRCLTDEEFGERRERQRQAGTLPQAKPRAKRSDAGKPRGSRAMPSASAPPVGRSRSVISSSDEEADD